MHEVLVNRLGGLSLPRKSVVRLTDRPDMTLDVYRGRKTTIQPTKTLFLSSMIHATSYNLTLIEPSKIAADDTFIFFFILYLLKKIRLDA